MYSENPLTKAFCFQGLEPFDSFYQILDFIKKFREISNDDIVIYTGYNKDEIKWFLTFFKNFDNIIIKYGRFIPGQEKHYDEILRTTYGDYMQLPPEKDRIYHHLYRAYKK